jgi:phenylalanyl-tRNA synthetase beta chain
MNRIGLLDEDVARLGASWDDWTGHFDTVLYMSHFYDIKGDVQALLVPREPIFERAEHPAMHPGRCARICLDGRPIGFLGELHPRWRQVYELPSACVMFELDLDAVLQRKLPQPQPIPKFQNIERDLAIVVKDQFGFDAVRAVIKESVPVNMLRGLVLFDVYRPNAAQGATGLAADEKSMAVRLSFSGDNVTMSDEQINQVLSVITKNLAQRCGARLRA